MQSNFVTKLKIKKIKGKKLLKNSFLHNLGLFFSTNENVLNNFHIISNRKKLIKLQT